MTRFEKILLVVNSLVWASFFVYSFAHVDLNLTISQNPTILNFINGMQSIGYYNRQTSTNIYVVLIIAAFISFTANLYLVQKQLVSINYIKTLILLSTVTSIISYPFLSYDIFNYIFDAKIVTVYNLSPYTHKALDFPQDDWIRFMRWTHRYSPYGPVWILISIVPSILGFGKFLLTLFMFKILMAGFHLLNSFLIYKIVNKIEPKKALVALSLYALNPLIIIEGMINGHNDVVLAAFLITPILAMINKKTTQSVLLIILGVLVKYIPVLNLPWVFANKVNKNVDLKKVIFLNIVTIAIFTVIYSNIQISVPFVSTGATQVQFQPWYLFWTLPLISLLPNMLAITFSILISIGALLRYIPYIYFGDWSQPGTITFMRNSVLTAIVFFAIYFISIYILSLSKRKKLL